MGRDEHNRTTSGKRSLSQTPKDMIKEEGMDVDFAEAFTDINDKKAMKRRLAAEQRVKED